MTTFINRPPAPATREVLGDELVDAADQLAANLAAVLEVHGVAAADASTAVGDLASTALRLIALSWRRAGRLASGSPRPAGPSSTSIRVTAPTVDAAGRRFPSNAEAVAGLVRVNHSDACVLAGLVCWSWTDPAGELVREVAVPGADHACKEDGGPWRSVPSGEGA